MFMKNEENIFFDSCKKDKINNDKFNNQYFKKFKTLHIIKVKFI